MVESKKRKFDIQIARYPLFFVGLLILIVGGLSAVSLRASESVVEAIAVVGFILLVLAVAIR